MIDPNWTAVDAYFNAHLTPPDPMLDAAMGGERGGGTAVHRRGPQPGESC